MTPLPLSAETPTFVEARTVDNPDWRRGVLRARTAERCPRYDVEFEDRTIAANLPAANVRAV